VVGFFCPEKRIPNTASAVTLSLRATTPLFGGLQLRVWDNLANCPTITVSFSGLGWGLIEAKVVIHCDWNKLKIPPHASFRNTERQSCYYIDLTEPAMG
jgi:hypothetical protein